MRTLTQEEFMKAANRYEVLQKIEKGLLRIAEASHLLGLSLRQIKRLRKRMNQGGLKALFSQRTHRAPNRVPEAEVLKILNLRRETYRAYNLLHFRDILKMRHGIKRSREFYRRLFLLKKLYSPQIQRRKPKHRKRFEAPQAGLLIQRDTSIHLWVPGADQPWKLILDLDDHSRKITGALFSYKDDVLSNMEVAWETISSHGLPLAYYTDNNPIFNPLNKKPKTGMYHFYRARSGQDRETVSQFKRALGELGIQLIHAAPYQPQGKGKIERLFRFMQDRLVNEMITAKVSTIHEANKYLKKWISWYNHHHLHSITKMIPQVRYEKSNAFRKFPKTLALKEVFCLKTSRQVKGDNTISLEGRTYQIPANAYRLSYVRAQVEVRVYLDQSMKIFYKNQEIAAYRRKKPMRLKSTQGGDILALHLG
jgi:transposase InsO family protein